MSSSTSPKPSYHLCPDFSIAPPPNGHLTLGSILKNLDIDGIAHPLNVNSEIPILDKEIYPRESPDSKTGFSRTLHELRSVQGSVWARIFGWDGVGGKLSFLRSRTDDETLTVEDLQTRYFIPTEEYMYKCLALPNVAMFVDVTRMKVPVYLVTGLKVAVGAKLSKANAKTTNVYGKMGATDCHTGASASGMGAYTSENQGSAGFDGSKPFVLGLRVRKIWWKNGVRQTADNVAGATLGETEHEAPDRGPAASHIQFVDDFCIGDTHDTPFAEVFVDEGEPGIEPSYWVFP